MGLMGRIEVWRGSDRAGHAVARGWHERGHGTLPFLLPFQFHWAKFVQDIPAVIRWSLFSLNFFFSALLLVVGLLGLAAAWNLPRNQPLALLIVGGAALFWLVNFTYLMIFLFPVPPSIQAVKLVLESFAAASFLLHAVPFGFAPRARVTVFQCEFHHFV